MKITMHGNPLTLVGTPIKAGETAPEFYGINQQMQPVSPERILPGKSL